VQKQVRREKPGFLKKSSRCCNGAVVVLRDRVGQLQSVAARHELGGGVKMTEHRLYTVENDGHFIGLERSRPIVTMMPWYGPSSRLKITRLSFGVVEACETA
jgi:hypothetical protein